jgi:hypothetical protein
MEKTHALEFRALELHGRSMWDHSRLEQVFAVIKDYGLNALVLHESDLTNQIVFPRSLFDPYSFWADAPVRRGFNAIHNDRVYMRYVLDMAEGEGVQVWLELKELTFPDEVLERYPYLLKNGVICPSEPIWYDFIERKFAELIADFPQLAGIITSPGSPEGRAALVQRKCRCRLCEETELSEWYRGIIESVHRPLSTAGAKLAVRDFSYKRADQQAMVEAVRRTPPDVVFCIKVTPHDFYPTFPHNPALGVLNRVQWIEYDVFGQYYGWGVFPCYMEEDLRRRYRYAIEKGASGVLLRVEWERINDLWCLETANRANLVIGAALATGANPTVREVCGQTLSELGLKPGEEDVSIAADALKDTWQIIRNGTYLDDFVFHDNSQFPLNLRKAWWTLNTHHSLSEWTAQTNDIGDLDEALIDSFVEKKEQALSKIRLLSDRIQTYCKARRSPTGNWLSDRYSLYELYIEGFRWISEVCLLARWSEQEGGGTLGSEGKQRFTVVLRSLARYAERLESKIKGKGYRHQLLMLLDLQRVQTVLSEGSKLYGRM